MSNKKSSMTASSWGLNRICGGRYAHGPDIEDWEDKRQNKFLEELEMEARFKNQKKSSKKGKRKTRKKNRKSK